MNKKLIKLGVIISLSVIVSFAIIKVIIWLSSYKIIDYDLELNYVNMYYTGINPQKSTINISDPRDSTAITHGFIHQLQHKDNPILFYFKYKYYDMTKGYLGNPFEKEAFDKQNNSYYLKNRPKNAYKSYINDLTVLDNYYQNNQ